MQSDFEFHINGVPHRAAGAPASTRLLDFMRENMQTAAKEACSGGACGACSVLLVDSDEFGEPAFRVVNACLLTLPMVAGREIWTVEGFGAGGTAHPVSEALAACSGQPCGFCLPGASAALCEKYEEGGELLLGEAVGQAIGNLCRCTGYRPFRDALVASMRAKGEATALAGRLPKRSAAPVPISYRDRAGQTFYRPETLLEAVRLRQAHPKAVLQAGGTSRAWGELDADEIAASGGVISLEAIAELSAITSGEDRWEIGANVTVAALVARLGEEYPTLSQMGARFGGAQIRNRATVGGNLAAAAHHGDLVPPLLALGASVRIDGVEGQRELPLDEFFVGFRQTALGTGEILAGILLPRLEPVGAGHEVTHRLQAFYKVSKRHHMDRAIANAGFLVEIDGDGIVTTARLALGGIAAYGARAYEAEALLEGEPWGAKPAQAAAAKLKEIFPASSDQRATAEYRNALAAGLWQKFFSEHRDPASPVYADASVRRFLAKPVAG